MAGSSPAMTKLLETAINPESASIDTPLGLDAARSSRARLAAAPRLCPGETSMLEMPNKRLVYSGQVSMFDLNQLRCFVAVAEELHFGRAAARLNMTQPPLSRQIQVLEHIIDAPLLERTSRSVKLTPAGRSFLPEARRFLKLAESASQVARRIALGKTGSLKIGYTAAAAYGYLPELIGACRQRLPDVDFSLKEMVSGEQPEALATGQIDPGLLRPPVGRPEFATKRVLAEPLLAAIPKK